MTRSPKRKIIQVAGIGTFFILLVIALMPFLLKNDYVSTGSTAVLSSAETEGESLPVVKHVNTPSPLKGIYMTACVAGTPSWRTSLKNLIKDTELNAVVIDIKDSTGVLSFSDEKLMAQYSNVINSKSGCYVRDMKDFIQELHNEGVYVIGRISVFQDPLFTKVHPELAVKSKSTGGVWKDRKGLSFIDVGAKEYWEYIVAISRSSYEIGFDELNYDYVRYPSDGNMSDTQFSWNTGTTTKAEMLKSFFSYLHTELSDVDAKKSVDLFGMTTTVDVDMNIGQILENALPYFDYIAPMVYPSHYPNGWNGFSNPASYPYEVIKIAMGRAVEREDAWEVSQGIATSTPSKMRPWLQDFDLGADYGPEQVRAQIRAANDVGLDSWMLWAASNKYTESALLPESEVD